MNGRLMVLGIVEDRYQNRGRSVSEEGTMSISRGI